MNRKHFRKLAELISNNLKNSTCGDEAERVAVMARGLAGLCATENPRFDYGRFYTACGLDTAGNVAAFATV